MKKRNKFLFLTVLSTACLFSLASCQGSQGIQGEKGEKGDTGAQGEKGEKGDTGAQGEKGDKGEKGDQGEKGDKGDKGDTGETGATGAKGDTAWSNTILPSTGGYVVPSVGSAVATTLFRFNIFEDNDYVAANLKLTAKGQDEEVIIRNEFKYDESSKCFYVEKKMVEGGYVVKASFTQTTVSTTVIDENGKVYDGVEEAITGNAKTIILTKDSTVNTSQSSNEVLYQTAGDYTIDLAGHDLTFKVKNRLVLKNGANLTLTGKGSIKSETNVEGNATVLSSDTSRGPIKIDKGTDETTSKLTVDKDVTLEGDQGIVIANLGSSSKAEIDVKGTIKAKFYGIAINGDNENDENVKVNVSGSIISSNDSEELMTTLGSGEEKKSYMSCGIYQAGPSIVTIEKSASIIANDSAIETRAGQLVVNGGTFLAKSTTFREGDLNASGSFKNDDRRIVGAGLSIVQHSTKKDIKVEIKGGTFTGYYGLCARDILKNNTKNVTITLNGGKFESTLASNGYYQGSDAYSFTNNGATFTPNNVVEVVTKKDEKGNDYKSATITINEKKEDSSSEDKTIGETVQDSIIDAVVNFKDEKQGGDDTSKDVEVKEIEVTLPKTSEDQSINLKDNEDNQKLQDALKDKDVTISGSTDSEGNPQTTYDLTKKDGGSSGENGSDYTFQSSNKVVLKDLVINLGNSNYNGFIRGKDYTFKNCVFVGMLTSVGSDGSNVVFEDCTFNSIEGNYNLWTYCNVKYQFTNCTFNNTTSGKFFNVYTDQSYNDPISIKIEGCTFNGVTTSNKPVLCVKLYNNTNWDIVWNKNTINNGASVDNIEAEFKTSSNTGYGVYSNIFGVRADNGKKDTDKDNYASTKITIDGTVRFENLEVKN